MSNMEKETYHQVDFAVAVNFEYKLKKAKPWTNTKTLAEN